MNYDKHFVPDEFIRKEISSEKWDLIGIGGLTSTYGRIKYLCRLIRRESSGFSFYRWWWME